MRSLAAALALGVALSFTPFVQAAKTAPDGTTVKKVADKEKKAHHPTKGTISSIDGDTVVVSSTDKKGEKKDHTFKTDSSTKIMVDGKEAKLSDLKAGQEVTVTPGTGKGAPASEIQVTAAK